MVFIPQKKVLCFWFNIGREDEYFFQSFKLVKKILGEYVERKRLSKQKYKIIEEYEDDV